MLPPQSQMFCQKKAIAVCERGKGENTNACMYDIMMQIFMCMKTKFVQCLQSLKMRRVMGKVNHTYYTLILFMIVYLMVVSKTGAQEIQGLVRRI